jgi:hypothetical protein
MTGRQGKAEVVAIEALPERNEDFLRSSIQSPVRTAPEAEMTEVLGPLRGRARRRASWLSRRLLPTLPDHAGRDLGASGSARPCRECCYPDALRPKGNKQCVRIT